MNKNFKEGGETLQEAKNTRSRKYQLTINNPLEKGYTHEAIRTAFDETDPIYYCLCDETGENGTPHTHIYVCYQNAVYFSTMKKRFPTAHIESARGSSQENRDYIRKEGRYLDSEKKETNHIETFEEYGEIPLDKSTKNETVSEQVYQMILDGCSNAEILAKHPSCYTKLSHIEKTRQVIKEEENKKKWRDVKVVYISGETGTGKTRFIMDKYGYENVYKVTNYDHPFDGYNGESVLLLDEFRSSLPFGDLLQYIDGYPCRLSARYADKIACFNQVFIVSNILLWKQYPNIQIEQPSSWNAFIRRLDRVVKFERNTNGEIPFYAPDEVMQYDEVVADYMIKTGGNGNV